VSQSDEETGEVYISSVAKGTCGMAVLLY